MKSDSCDRIVTMVRLFIIVSSLAASAAALKVHESKDGAAPAMDFKQFYMAHSEGRGIWKWGNALDAYSRHFLPAAGKAVSVAEVGVQSGGSLLMWRGVMGPLSKVYGLDINPECKQFQDTNVDITIGDQGNWTMWNSFFAKVGTGLDILVDDGSHLSPHMLTTISAAFPQIRTGGYIAIEDIHGTYYLDSFFKPSATFFAKMAEQNFVSSVHIYPMLLVVRKGGKELPKVLTFSGQEHQVADFPAMWAALHTIAGGNHIVLRNPAWPNLFTSDALTNFFSSFDGLHDSAFVDTPKGCRTTSASECTNAISPLSYAQSKVTGVHIYSDHAVIEVPAAPVKIDAVRRGTKWIGYGL